MTACLLGGALGDSIGSHFEGSAVGDDFAMPTDLRITDDTQLTIATCEAIIDAQAVDPESVAKHFLRWFRERRIRGIGASTLKALTELDAGGHWAMVGAMGERAAGNGAAMRIAPLAFFLDPDIDEERQTIRDICRITHRHDEAYLGALAVVRTIRHGLAGGELNADVFAVLIDALPDSNVRDRLAVVLQSRCTVGEYSARFSTSGYVVDSVSLAILAAVQATDISDTIVELVRCGGDTDTIASMFGQIFGAAYGMNSLPMDVISQIDAVTMIRKTAAELSEVRF